MISENSIIAVIVPVYNTELYLMECLDSIRTQTFNKFTCIIVNDGSTDNSSEIAHSFAMKDPRFKVYDIANGGVSSARNYAIDVLNKMTLPVKYVYFLDADDIISSTLLEHFVKYMDSYQADYAECGMKRWFADDEEVDTLARIRNIDVKVEYLEHRDILLHFFSEDRFATNYSTSHLGLCNKCIRFDKICDIRFDVNFDLNEDQKFILELYPKLKNEVLICQDEYFYRMRASSATGTTAHSEKKYYADLEFFDAILECSTDEYVRQIIIAREFKYLYTAWKESALLCPTVTDTLFIALKKHWDKYAQFCPLELRHKIAKVSLGLKFNRMYLNLRSKASKRRRKHRNLINHTRFK